MELYTKVFLVKYSLKEGEEVTERLIEEQLPKFINYLIIDLGVNNINILYVNTAVLSDEGQLRIDELETEIEDIRENYELLEIENSELKDKLDFVHDKISCSIDELNEAYDESDY